ncbi:hypothetical protein [Croceiramulus getboli]|nr:hypothetical protein P8624_08825 [Flavobacteriaceae bacterium YJPT1-3]
MSSHPQQQRTPTEQIENPSRRSFFIHLALASAGAMLPGFTLSCQDDPQFRGSGKVPFRVWEEMMEALQQSPDHFPARYAALVQSGDLAGMHAFIAQDLALLPSDDQYFRAIGTGMRYGPKAALRSGMATPREKAELLCSMAQEAGFTAKVVYERVPLTEEQVKAILFRTPSTSFDPPISDRQAKAWLEALGASSENGSVTTLKQVEDQAKSLANRLLADLSDDQREADHQVRFFFDEDRIPTVEVTSPEGQQYLHVFDPNVPFGSLHPANEQGIVSEARVQSGEDPEVQIDVTGINAIRPNESIPLISGKWKTSQLIGNQIQLRFLKNMTFEEQAVKTINQVTSFTPSLSLQDIDEETNYLEEHSFLGEPIGLDGYNVLPEPDSKAFTTHETSAPASVTQLTIKSFPKAYPAVEVHVYPEDEQGQLVEGLQASHFTFHDNETPVNALMRQNRIAPQVLLMYDTSLSMPISYRGEGMQNFLKQTEAVIRKKYPYAEVKLQETGSTIYTSYFQACQTRSDLILYATDGHNNDEYDPAFAKFYADAPPTLLLNVYNIKEDWFEEIATQTGSQSIFAEDQETTLEAVSRYLDELSLPPYVFTFHSFDADQEHELKVRMNAGALKASSTFQFPPQDHWLGNQLLGLYLTIKIGNEPVIQRTLAGYDPETTPAADRSRSHQLEVHEMLLGTATLAIEREGAPLSVRLTEYLRCQLSQRDWYEAYLDGNTEQAIEFLAQGSLSYPSVFLSGMQPLHQAITEEHITIPKGLRMAILKFKPGLPDRKSQVSFDFLPTSRYHSWRRDGQSGFTTTAQKTAQLALLEADLFSISTYTLLKEKDLLPQRELRDQEQFNRSGLEEDYHYFYYTVYKNRGYTWCAQDFSTRAYWRMDTQTGEIYGILPDQTGGGGEEQLLQLKELQAVVDYYERKADIMNLGMAVAGVGNTPLGVAASHGLTLVKLYAIATEAIIIMDTSNMSEQMKKALAELACNVFRDIQYSYIGQTTDTRSGIKVLIAAMGGDFSFTRC